MHILHLYKDYFPVLGGIENHVRALAEAQVRRGHTVTVLVTSPTRHTRRETLNGVQVIKAARLATIASTPLSVALPLILRDLRPDITHVQSPYPVAELACLLGGPRPYVVSHQADVSRPAQRLIMLAYGPLFQRFLREAARVLVTSPGFARTSPHLRAVQDRLALAPLGVDENRFTPATQTTTRPFTMLFVGVLRHYKGVDDLLRAFKLLTVEARLIIAGEGQLQKPLEVMARDFGLADRVTFAGRVPDDSLPGLYRSGDVLVLPSLNRAESFGTVLVEAMLSGLPCLTTKVGSGTSYVVQHDVTGFVVPPHSPAALADALTQLQRDPALRARLGAAGRERARREFTVERMVERVEAVYEEVNSSR
ncbi:MAG: glycosyltransferase [Anaerolineales bacterium]